jgi:hypothetical protein
MKIQTKKTIVVLVAFLLATMLLVSMASAKTADRNLPSKSQILKFISSYRGSGDFVDTVSADSVSVHPSWTWDKWQDEDGNKYISFYYKITNKKHGSIYFDDDGYTISPKNLNLELMDSYQGIP